MTEGPSEAFDDDKSDFFSDSERQLEEAEDALSVAPPLTSPVAGCLLHGLATSLRLCSPASAAKAQHRPARSPLAAELGARAPSVGVSQPQIPAGCSISSCCWRTTSSTPSRRTPGPSPTPAPRVTPRPLIIPSHTLLYHPLTRLMPLRCFLSLSPSSSFALPPSSSLRLLHLLSLPLLLSSSHFCSSQLSFVHRYICVGDTRLAFTLTSVSHFWNLAMSEVKS